MRRTPRLASIAILAAFGATVLPAVANSVEDPVPSDVTEVRTKQSLLGTHTWYAQTYQGVPVLDGYYAVHTTGGTATIDDGRLDIVGLTSTSPKLTNALARDEAAKHGNTKKSRLVVVADPRGGPAKLAWELITDQHKIVLVDADQGNVIKVEDERIQADGQGQVFDPNPVVALQNQALTDGNNADSAALAAAYKTVTLSNLAGNGYLQGSFVNIANKKKGKQPLAFSRAESYFYPRSDDRFEQTNAYYAIDRLQTYIQSLGFDDVNNESQDVFVNTITADNSYYSPSADAITLGTGGVDDGEDQEVIWHEYGHAIHDDQVPNFGSSNDAGAIGEAFGDYIAATMSQATSPDTDITPWACIMDWDSVAYTSTTPHCIRRLDTNKTVANRTGAIHTDGEIWGQALWDMNLALGRDKATTVILEAQFSYSPSTTWAAAAQTTVDTANALYGATDAATVKAAFQARGIL